MGSVPRIDIKASSLAQSIIGEGRVVIPHNISRKDYISRCIRLNRVSIYTAGAGFCKDVSVAAGIMENIKFPDDINGFGSVVMFVRLGGNVNERVIFAVRCGIGEYSSSGEGQKSLSGASDTGTSGVFIDGEGSTVTILASDSKSGGKVVISAGGKAASGEIELSSIGKINVVSDDIEFAARESVTMRCTTLNGSKADIIIKDGISISWSGSDISLDDRGISIDGNSVTLGSGVDSAVLGRELVSLLTDLFMTLSTTTVPTTNGASPLSSAGTIASYISRLNKILSTKISIE